MKIIFLDFDGVLNNSEYLKQQSEIVFDPFDPENMRNLNYLFVETGARVVVSSEWRKFNMPLGILLAEQGFRGGDLEGLTPVLNGMPRGMEIQGWLIKNKSKEIESFVILDDRVDMGYISDRLIQTDMATGLTKENAEQAIRMLNE